MLMASLESDGKPVVQLKYDIIILSLIISYAYMTVPLSDS